MSRGQNPLVLMMALSLPGAANALGLGEIHVNSALNEPLAADIEILGATAEELSSLTASVANKDTFLRFGAERPAFLASATFRVAQDVKGKPVLVIRSTDSFTEPVVNLLVDLRWHNGEVIRQYSLLLDPAGFPSATQVAAAVHSPMAPPASLALPAPPSAVVTNTLAVAASPIASSDATASPAANTTRTTTHVKIGAKATLRGVAWRVGARSDSDLKKTMLAIFRANPHAFEGNINRLHLGAVLRIPSAADISTISKEDAGREIDAQMAAWRPGSQKVRSAAAPVKAMGAPVQAMPAPVQGITPTVPAATPIAGDAAEAAALNLRVRSLEQGLHDIQGQLVREHDKLLGVQAQVRYAEQTVNDPVAAAPAPRQWLLTSLIGGLALLAGALGVIFLKLRRRATPKTRANSTMAGSVPIAAETSVAAKVVAEEPALRETPSTVPRPAFEDSIELSAARNSRRDKPEAKVGEPSSTAPNTDVAARPKHVFTVNEDELRAAYEDTLDLSGETAILASEIATGNGDTANLPAATVSLNARALQAAAGATADESAAVDESANESADESVTVMIGTEKVDVDATKLDYNLVDLDLTAQHVHMPSVLNERAVVKERRTNLVDVLKKAVEREPDRRDLRMKLLETYYAAAAANRQAFLDVVQKLARDRDRLGEGEWDKIALMGKQIASDTALFSEDSEIEDDNKLADCA
ncbi:MAG TPA: FimV/HubP family polar landmark protein [Steroidobacteraceae bacterium]|nr:FimV/HubP family polar landmark protein [Steroidobacteraceae bacterium]